jgi:hypothetical protein
MAQPATRGATRRTTISHLVIVDQGVLYANPYQGDWAINAYFPHILELEPNHLLCVYRRGAAMYSDDGRIYQLRSTDNGHTWKDDGQVWDGNADSKTYWYAPAGLTLTPEKEILLTGFRIHRPTPTTLTYNEKTRGVLSEETLLFRSKDMGRTWTPPQVIPYPVGLELNIDSGVVMLNDGRWLIVFDVAKGYDDPTPLHQYVVGLCSKDQGKTWDEIVNIAGGPNHPKTFWHARGIAKLADGRLVTFAWTGDATGEKFFPLHRIVSDSEARKWSEPESVGIQGQTNWPVDLGNGRMALIYSFRESPRPGEYVALSEDEGRTWDTARAVQVWDAYGKESIGAPRTATYPASHDNIAYGAPQAIRLSDGDVLVSWWAGQSGQMVCRWCRLQVKS